MLGKDSKRLIYNANTYLFRVWRPRDFKSDNNSPCQCLISFVLTYISKLLYCLTFSRYYLWVFQIIYTLFDLWKVNLNQFSTLYRGDLLATMSESAVKMQKKCSNYLGRTRVFINGLKTGITWWWHLFDSLYCKNIGNSWGRKLYHIILVNTLTQH
jgi:hypothetical protein